MGRRKLKHELISDESTRKVTFRKRKAGLLKKLKELSILCGVVACAVIFSSYNSSPDVWPSRSEAVSVMENLKDLSPKKQRKYMMDQESFLAKTISELKEKLEKQKMKNDRIELELFYAECIKYQNSDSIKIMEDNHWFEEYLKFISNGVDLTKDS